jgi:hypothetical protein
MGRARRAAFGRAAAALFVVIAVSCTTGHRRPGSSPKSAESGLNGEAGAPPPPASLDGLGPPPGVSRPTGGVFTAPGGIPRGCSVDVTPQLASWIASVPDNSVLSFPKDACYEIDGTLGIEDRRDLLIEGNGATLKAKTEGDRNRAHLRIRRSSNITVRGLVVRGANPAGGTGDAAYRPKLEGQHAFDLGRVDGVLLDDVQAYDVFGDFVYIGGGDTPSTNVTVRNSHFARNGRQGISVTNGEDILIEANFISDVRRSLFDLEPNGKTGRALHVKLLFNRTGRVHNFWLASKGAGSDVGDVLARGNDMQAASGNVAWVRTPPWLGPRKGFTFDRNTFLTRNDVSDEGSVGALFFENCADVTVTGNRVKFSQDVPAVELRRDSRVDVHGNHFQGSTAPVKADAASSDVQRG